MLHYEKYQQREKSACLKETVFSKESKGNISKYNIIEVLYYQHEVQVENPFKMQDIPRDFSITVSEKGSDRISNSLEENTPCQYQGAFRKKIHNYVKWEEHTYYTGLYG